MPDTPKTVRVRVALAVDAQGRWFAYGWHDAPEGDPESVIYDMAADAGDLSWRWLNAEVEVPAPQEVQADVERP